MAATAAGGVALGAVVVVGAAAGLVDAADGGAADGPDGDAEEEGVCVEVDIGLFKTEQAASKLAAANGVTSLPGV